MSMRETNATNYCCRVLKSHKKVRVYPQRRLLKRKQIRRAVFLSSKLLPKDRQERAQERECDPPRIVKKSTINNSLYCNRVVLLLLLSVSEKIKSRAMLSHGVTRHSPLIEVLVFIPFYLWYKNIYYA